MLAAVKLCLQHSKINLHSIAKYQAHRPLGVLNNGNVLSRNLYTEKDLESTELIYEGSLAKKVLFIKSFSLFTSVGAIPLQYCFWLKTENPLLGGIILGSLSIFQFGSPFLINYMTKKYVIKMYYDKEKDRYIAHTYNVICQDIFTDFTPEDVSTPSAGMFANMKVKDKHLFIDSAQFTDIEHYKRILGYDKPLKLEFDEDNK